MSRIRRGAFVVGVALAIASGAARAQETTGRVTGLVVDQDTGAPLGGVTVIVQGPQGDDATTTNDKGQYTFTGLAVGSYVVRFYVANTAAQVEQPGVIVSAEKTVRVNAKIAGAVRAAAQQVYVISGKPPAVDVGSARVGTTFDQSFARNLPNGQTYGDLIQKAPGAFVDPSGNVAIGGATGLENIYVVNGMNVTGIDLGKLESGGGSAGGGTNLPLEFLTQVDVNAGGYQAEYGGAMGGVINSVLKSGTNQLRGSVFGAWSPYWLAGDPRVISTNGGALGSVRKPDFDSTIGVEVGGPIVKDKLFFWVGLAPRFQNTHVFRLTYAQEEATDPTTMMPTGMAALDANGNPRVHELRDWRARIDERRKVWSYAATVDFIPAPDHKLTLALFGTPSFNDQMRSFLGIEALSNPDWSRESLTKTNTDATLHWTSKLFDRHWQLEALAGTHSEYFNDRSPIDALNGRNQLEIYGANLWDLEHAPGCEPTTTGFQPCPVPLYHSGGFGMVNRSTGQRWMGELKSTHLFDAGGAHEIKYGWHLETATFDQTRYYSGPPGARALVQQFPGGMPPNFYTQSFFTLGPNEFPTDYGTMHPRTDLLYPPDYRDQITSNVKSVSQAFFLQEGWSPQFLRNLTINVGARVELQKIYDTYGKPFLDTDNISPRAGAVFDPFNDGRSKISASYGRYFEAVPLNIATRYFGGEGFVGRQNVPFSKCGVQDPYAWNGSGEWKDCPIPAKGDSNDPDGQSFLGTNGKDYPVQAHLKGQYHNEIVATVEREIIEDLSVRLDYVHRWLGTIIEDSGGTTGGFVLANPGNVPGEAITDAKAEVYDAEQAVAAHPADANAASALGAAQAKLKTLQDLTAVPKPERTYDALSITLAKRFSNSWFARGSYTYSRLVGNYEGLFQAESLYPAPNGNNAYDYLELMPNSRGRLPNDRPHLGRIDGYYAHPVGKGNVVAGLSFSGQSGMPRNYMSALLSGYQLTFLLPRGSAGRTPPITQFDGHLAYLRELAPRVNLEVFVDVFNLFNQQAAVLVDDNYTLDQAAPIPNGTPDDLKFAKNTSGQPLAKNANFGNALTYQAPINARLGVRVTF